MTTTNTKPSEAAIELLRDLARAYTRHHTTLRVDGADMTGAIVLTLKGDRDDHPKLVGTRGAHIQALRTIFSVIGAKIGRRINLTLLEPDSGQKGDPTPFVANHDWQPDGVLGLMRRVLDASLPSGYRLNPVRVSDLTTIEVIPAMWLEELYGETEPFPRAVHAIFHAIGKTEGHDIHVVFVKEP